MFGRFYRRPPPTDGRYSLSDRTPPVTGWCLVGCRSRVRRSFCGSSLFGYSSSVQSGFSRGFSSAGVAASFIISVCRHQNGSLCKLAIERDSAHRIIIAWDDVVYTFWLRIRVNNSDNRDVEAIGFFSNRRPLLVSMTKSISGRPPISLMPPRVSSSYHAHVSAAGFPSGQLVDFLAFHSSFKVAKTTN